MVSDDRVYPSRGLFLCKDEGVPTAPAEADGSDFTASRAGQLGSVHP